MGRGKFCSSATSNSRPRSVASASSSRAHSRLRSRRRCRRLGLVEARAVEGRLPTGNYLSRSEMVFPKVEQRGINDAVNGLDFNFAAGGFLRSSGEGRSAAMDEVNKPATGACPEQECCSVSVFPQALRFSPPAGSLDVLKIVHSRDQGPTCGPDRSCRTLQHTGKPPGVVCPRCRLAHGRGSDRVQPRR